MRHTLRSTFLAAALVAGIAGPASVQAALIGSHVPTGHQLLGMPTAATSDYLTEAVASAGSMGASAGVASTQGDPAAFPMREQAQAFRLPQLPALQRGDTDLFLWNLLRLIHAHHDGKRFALAEKSLEYVHTTIDKAPPSAVPLPGAVWFMLMGLLGLAGTRLSGDKKIRDPDSRDGSADRREGARALGGQPA